MIRANHSDVLFLQSYVGVGATEEQFMTTLRMSGIKVVFRRDVDSAPFVGELNGTLLSQPSAITKPPEGLAVRSLSVEQKWNCTSTQLSSLYRDWRNRRTGANPYSIGICATLHFRLAQTGANWRKEVMTANEDLLFGAVFFALRFCCLRVPSSKFLICVAGVGCFDVEGVRGPNE
jgi:hypothetical protein